MLFQGKNGNVDRFAKGLKTRKILREDNNTEVAVFKNPLQEEKKEFLTKMNNFENKLLECTSED